MVLLGFDIENPNIMLQKFDFTFKRLIPMLVGAITIAAFSRIPAQSKTSTTPLNSVSAQSKILATIPRPGNLYQSDSSAFERITWQLSEWKSKGQSIRLLPSHPITIRFDGKRLGGSTGCNDYSAEYQFQNFQLHLPRAIISTKRGCISAVANRENWFASALKASYAVAFLKPDKLIIEYKAASGKGFLGFTPMRSQLKNTDWHLSSITIGSTTQTTPQPITLKFTADSIGGSAGCNEYSAAYEASRNRIKIGGIATTEKMCSLSQMQLEQSFLAKLETVQRYEIINHAQNLKLFFQQGNQAGVLTFRLPDN